MVDDVEALSLVWQCREMEERYKSNFTSLILNAEEPLNVEIIRKAQDHIIKKDQVLLLAKVFNYQHPFKIAECVDWKKLWDHPLQLQPLCHQGYEEFGESD